MSGCGRFLHTLFRGTNGGKSQKPAATVRVKFLDVTGAEQELEASGLLATCLQHEIDHLDGVLFIDHISKLKRDRVIKKFAKAAKRSDTE